MQILPADKLFQPQHKDYLGWRGENPHLRVASRQDAEYVWYCACGDGDDLKHDLGKCQEHGLPVISVTLGDGDYTDCLHESNQRLHFSTMSRDWDRCVPYFYQDEPAVVHDKPLLASFIGSLQTNPERARLTSLAANDVVIEVSDWWHQENRHPELRERYNWLLDNSLFALCPSGIGRSSMRLTDAIMHNAIPIMIDDQTKLFGQELGEFALWAGLKERDMEYAINVAREMDPAEYDARLNKMRKFREKYLMRDRLSRCNGTLGYTEYIREYVLKTKS